MNCVALYYKWPKAANMSLDVGDFVKLDASAINTNDRPNLALQVYGTAWKSMEGSGKVLGCGRGKSWRVQVQPGLECVIGASKCTKVDSNEEMRLPPPSNEQGARLDLGFDDEFGSDDEDENGHAEGSNSVKLTAPKPKP